MNCHVCNLDIKSTEWKFCPGCGANLTGLCPECGAKNPSGVRFCVECGAFAGSRAGLVRIGNGLSIMIDAPAGAVLKTAAAEPLPVHSAASVQAVTAAELHESLMQADTDVAPPPVQAVVEETAQAEPEEKESVLDLASFNASVTPDFMKGLKQARGHQNDRMEEGKSDSGSQSREDVLDSRSFNASGTPDFLKAIIEKKNRENKDKAAVIQEEKTPQRAPANAAAVSEEPALTAETFDVADEVPVAVDVKSTDMAVEHEKGPMEKQENHEEVVSGKKAEPKPAASFEKFKPSLRIDDIIKKEIDVKSWVAPAAQHHVSEPAVSEKHTEEHRDDVSLPKPSPAERPEVPARPEAGPIDETVKKVYRLIAVDSGNNRVQFVTSEGRFISSFGSRGQGPGQFDNPQKAVVDGFGDIYISDFSNNRIQKFNRNGQYIMSFGGYGNKNGEFNYPAGLAVSKEGLIFIVDSYNNRIQIFDADGKYVSRYEGNDLPGAGFDTPAAVAIDNDNHIYVCDTGNNRVIKFDSKWRKVYDLGQPSGKNVGFDSPSGIFVDASNNLIVADTGNHLIKIFDSVGDLISCFGSKGQKEGKLDSPGSVSADAENRVYIADTWNNRIQIFSYDGKFVRSIGSYGSDPARFNHINDVLVQSEVE